jgi:hypothetical protein
MIAKFEVGESYASRSLADYDTVYIFTIVARTDKTISTTVRGELVKSGIRVYDNQETFKPFGTYSMCPVIYAGIRSIELAEMSRLSQIGREGAA